MVPKIYYKSYIPFVCVRKEKFLIFSINFIFICDFSSIEIYEVFGMRSKGICIGKKKGAVCFIFGVRGRCLA